MNKDLFLPAFAAGFASCVTLGLTIDRDWGGAMLALATVVLTCVIYRSNKCNWTIK